MPEKGKAGIRQDAASDKGEEVFGREELSIFGIQGVECALSLERFMVDGCGTTPASVRRVFLFSFGDFTSGDGRKDLSSHRSAVGTFLTLDGKVPLQSVYLTRVTPRQTPPFSLG